MEDIPHQQEAVVDQIDLDVAHLLLTDESLHPVHDYVGGSRVSERFFCPHQTGGQLKLSLSSLICLEIVHGAQTFNGNGQVHQQSNDGIKDLHVVSSIEEDRNQIFLKNLKKYNMIKQYSETGGFYIVKLKACLCYTSVSSVYNICCYIKSRLSGDHFETAPWESCELIYHIALQ